MSEAVLTSHSKERESSLDPKGKPVIFTYWRHEKDGGGALRTWQTEISKIAQSTTGKVALFLENKDGTKAVSDDCKERTLHGASPYEVLQSTFLLTKPRDVMRAEILKELYDIYGERFVLVLEHSASDLPNASDTHDAFQEVIRGGVSNANRDQQMIEIIKETLEDPFISGGVCLFGAAHTKISMGLRQEKYNVTRIFPTDRQRYHFEPMTVLRRLRSLTGRDPTYQDYTKAIKASTIYGVSDGAHMSPAEFQDLLNSAYWGEADNPKKK